MPELRVRRDSLSDTELVDGEAVRELEDGEALLSVERFALSANNITYGVFGDALGYWKLFPAEDGWGRIPAWGYARVEASRAPAAPEGARVLGLVPMGPRFVARPMPSPMGFADTSAHRAELSPVYNAYQLVDGEGDDAALVMRPLFGTSVLLDLVLEEAGFHGAGAIVLTSASSKTAYGLAHLLRERPVATIGLTSPQRVAWVASLGLYDEVLGYDALDGLSAPEGAVAVDFAGDRALLRRVHEALGDVLRHSILVGFTHHEAAPDEAAIPGPAPEFFFAPTEMAKRGR